MNNNSESQTIEKFVSKYISTSSIYRKTSIAEFNADGEYMGSLKESYYDHLQFSYSEQDKKECIIMMDFMKAESKRLKLKHYG